MMILIQGVRIPDGGTGSDIILGIVIRVRRVILASLSHETSKAPSRPGLDHPSPIIMNTVGSTGTQAGIRVWILQVVIPDIGFLPDIGS